MREGVTGGTRYFFYTSSVLAPVLILVITEDESFPLDHFPCIRILTSGMDFVGTTRPINSKAAPATVTIWQRPLSVPQTDPA